MGIKKHMLNKRIAKDNRKDKKPFDETAKRVRSEGGGPSAKRPKESEAKRTFLEEMTDAITNAIDAETNARNAAIADETTARNAAIDDETTARNAAIAGKLDTNASEFNGNAATATRLKTAKKISGKDFDGSVDVTLDILNITNGANYYNSLTGGTNINTSGNTINLDNTLLDLTSVTSNNFIGDLQAVVWFP